MSSADRGKALATKPSYGRGAWFVLAAALALAGCGDATFRPLYAPTGLGAEVSEKFKQVDFAPIPGRVGQRIRNEMVFQSTGGGNALPPSHRFEVVLSENLVSTLVKSTGEAEGQVYTIQAAFRLIDTNSKKVVFQGSSHARAAFERFESIYSNVRAREDAENRAAQTIASDLKTRLAAFLSRSS